VIMGADFKSIDLRPGIRTSAIYMNKLRPDSPRRWRFRQDKEWDKIQEFSQGSAGRVMGRGITGDYIFIGSR